MYTRLNDEQKKRYISVVLLNMMLNKNHIFLTEMSGVSIVLIDTFKSMLAEGLIVVHKDRYMATPKGDKILVAFEDKYFEYLKCFDLYCAVDMERGDFAFEKFYDFQTDADWQLHLVNPRFEDMRIAVAEFKKIDPFEFVFMSFINENRIEMEGPDWEWKLTNGQVWDEIYDIIDNAVHITDIPADEMEEMIKIGAELMVDLIRKEDIRNAELALEDEGEEIVTTTTTTVIEEEEIIEEDPYCYYESYYDPFYISPIWIVPVLLLW